MLHKWGIIILLWCCIVSLSIAKAAAASDDNNNYSFSKRYTLYRKEVPKVRPNVNHRRLQDSGHAVASSSLVPLHLGTGTHYTWVYVGKPDPQRASVIVDTGSHIMAFPCAGCSNCGTHTDPPFDMEKSTSIEYASCRAHPSGYRCQTCRDDDKCVVRQSYTEGSSWTATLVEDFVWLGNDTEILASEAAATAMEDFGVRMNFGCQIHETGLFTTQKADGIMGLANYEITLIPALYKAHKIDARTFSLCLSPSGGSMVLGSPERIKHTSEIKVARMIESQSTHWFALDVRAILIGGVDIKAPVSTLNAGKGIIVDSGTTDSFFPSAIGDLFRQTFAEVASVGYKTAYSGACRGYTREEMAKLPDMSLVVASATDDDELVTLNFPPEIYMEQAKNGKFCGTVYLNEPSGGVFGANLMMNRDIMFNDDEKTIAFADANCDFEQPKSNAGSPLSTTEAPETTTEAPVTTTEAPVTTTEAPVSTTEAPASTTEAPVSTTEAPVTTTEAPLTTTEAPVSTTEAPEATTEAPEATTEAPPTEVPATLAPAVETTEAPVTTPPATEAPAEKSKIDSGIDDKDNNGSLSTADHPVILSIIGVLIAILFCSGMILAVKKRRDQRRRWTKLDQANEEDSVSLVSVNVDDEDDDDVRSGSRTPRNSSRPVAYSDDAVFDDDEDEFFDTSPTVEAAAGLGNEEPSSTNPPNDSASPDLDELDRL